MPTTSASIEVPVSASRVWQLIGGFNSLPDWLPFVPHSELSEGGRVRNLKTVDGETIVERLEAFDEKGRSYSYSFVQAPFPAKDYLATLSVQDVAGKEASVVQWSGSFTPVGVSDNEVTELFHGIYVEGLAALKQSLATRSSID
ncbi:Polyketide cyclase / dehydrase and lipid transport [Paraburkholderia fungorum]|uniref:Polyketide cyclase / dehydrase and lipid transport n=1 Tax=Paraburkholderia fungorum TaxID=134537 RepID=A0A1H1I789_9BURK|nr:SRPBCC family protein [Paraburkholderia fungorum]SDR33604.1 Polyketide cyclase / dehydrase and lipid transport [Paraburkholderia fungorum]